MTGPIPPNDRTRRVVRPHDASQPESIRLHAGNVVAVGRRDDDWPGWLWCTADDGRESWVPEAFLDQTPHRATALRDYDATEFTVVPGETVTVVEEVAGWSLCRRVTDQGWVPDDCFAAAEPG
jgi:hypothetical protein